MRAYDKNVLRSDAVAIAVLMLCMMMMMSIQPFKHVFAYVYIWQALLMAADKLN